MMKLIAITDLMYDLVSMYPNYRESRTKLEKVKEEGEWANDVLHALRIGKLPYRKENGRAINLPDSNAEQELFRKAVDANFINRCVAAHDVVEWLKFLKLDANIFAAKYCVNDAVITAGTVEAGTVVVPAREPVWYRRSVAPVAVIAPAVALPDAPVVGVSTSKPAASGTVTHSTKAPRRYTLTPVIELAQSKCRNPTDTAEVWAQLLVLAENRTAPLIGATDEGLQYLDKGTAAIFTRDALNKKLHPEKRGAPGKRR